MLKTLVAAEVGGSLRHRNEDSAQRLGSGPRCGPVASSGSCGPVTGSTVFLAGLMPLIATRSARNLSPPQPQVFLLVALGSGLVWRFRQGARHMSGRVVEPGQTRRDTRFYRGTASRYSPGLMMTVGQRCPAVGPQRIVRH